MTAKAAPNDKQQAAPPPAPLYDAFPEPSAWAVQWDGAALQAITKPKPKQQPYA